MDVEEPEREGSAAGLIEATPAVLVAHAQELLGLADDLRFIYHQNPALLNEHLAIDDHRVHSQFNLFRIEDRRDE